MMMINLIQIVNPHHNRKNHHNHNRPHNNKHHNLNHPLNLAQINHNRPPPPHLNHLNNLILQLSLSLPHHPLLHKILTENKKSTQ